MTNNIERQPQTIQQHKRANSRYTRLSLMVLALLTISNLQNVNCLNIDQQSKGKATIKEVQALSTSSTTDELALSNSNTLQKQKVNDVDLLIDMQDGMNMMQHAFLNKKQNIAEDGNQQKQELELSQIKSSSDSSDGKVSETVDELMSLKKNLKGIYETKFVVDGVVWSVWDWTIFVFILAFIGVAAIIAFLSCLCCYPTRYEDEMEANDAQSDLSKKEDKKERLDTERRLSVNLAAAMEATKDLPEREVKAPEKMEGDAEAMME